MTAARGGEATLFDAMLAEARSTKEGLDRRNLTMALFSFGDPALAKRGLSLLLDPLFDIRESFTALRFAYPWNPTRRAPHDFIMANFDALIARVGRDNGGYWPYYASGLCSEQDRAAVNTFWTPKSASMPGAAHQLALSEEAIGLCARLRQGQRTQSQLSAPPV